MDLYDLDVVIAAQRPIAGSEHGIDDEALSKTGLISLGVEHEEGKRLLGLVRQAGARGYLMPVAYRKPRISLEQARELASRKHQELRKSGKRLLELMEGYNDGLWWTFAAEDEDALEKDLTPGAVFISIDKLDGSLRTKEQYQKWLALSSL